MNREWWRWVSNQSFAIHDSRLRRDYLIRRACVVLAAAACWSLVAVVTGGVSISLGFLHFSSRNPRNPALIATLTFAVAWALSERGERIAPPAGRPALGRGRYSVRHSHERGVGGRRVTSWIRVACPDQLRHPSAPWPLPPASSSPRVKEAQFVAGASDAWGYVGHAEMWATWTLRTPQPLMIEMTGFLPREALAPLAYRPSLDGSSIVPVTSPGLPMLMGLFQVVGGRASVFAVVPLLAAVAGRADLKTRWACTLGDRWTGVVAAALVATSPAFLFQLAMRCRR